MRLLVLNVNAPGTDRAEAIARTILAAEPDVAVLTEVTRGEGARLLRDTLKAGGLTATVKGTFDPPAVPHAVPHAVAVASASAHASSRLPFEGTEFAGCALEVTLDELVIAAVHAPGGDAGFRFRRDALADLADELGGRPAVIAGTTGPVRGPVPYGWIDAFSAANPRTPAADAPDRVLISPAISRTLRAAYRDRIALDAGLVAHVAVVVELDLG
jgi:hypothetical protein